MPEIPWLFPETSERLVQFGIIVSLTGMLMVYTMPDPQLLGHAVVGMGNAAILIGLAEIGREKLSEWR